jgi:hypothetical protein
MFVPGNWTTVTEDNWGGCSILGQELMASSVLLDTGEQDLSPSCAATRSQGVFAPTSGLAVDPGKYGPLSDVNGFDACMHINGLSVCPTSQNFGGILVLAVHVPGLARPVAVEIGLAGHGKVAHTILYSMRATRSARNVVPPTPTTIKPSVGQWPQRTIASTGDAQDIVPTSDGIYWLSLNGPASGDPSAVAPARYYSGHIEVGPSINGSVGFTALTVAGGWVWVAVGVGKNVVVEEFDPVTLALRATHSLVPQNVFDGYPLDPVLTATVDGPLWVAGEGDLWAFNPSSGAVEKEFDSGVDMGSMSTDPTGSVLYTGGQTSRSPVVVTEYDARTGKELAQVNLEGAGGVTVAGTVGGVWVGWRTGNAGQITKLSADGLRNLAATGGLTNDSWLGTYETGGAVDLGVSGGTLWVSSVHTLGASMCGNPITGAMRSAESTFLGNSTASGGKLYAFSESGLVEITPPAACFG